MLGGLLGCGEAEGDGEPQVDPQRAETRAIMQKLFESLRVVLPLSVDRAALLDPKNAAQIRASLDALSNNAALVSNHMASRRTSMRTISRNLERDAAALSAR